MPAEMDNLDETLIIKFRPCSGINVDALAPKQPEGHDAGVRSLHGQLLHPSPQPTHLRGTET